MPKDLDQTSVLAEADFTEKLCRRSRQQEIPGEGLPR